MTNYLYVRDYIVYLNNLRPSQRLVDYYWKIIIYMYSYLCIFVVYIGFNLQNAEEVTGVFSISHSLQNNNIPYI